ncbi:hypothetical protein [Wolbachia endosymbiont of Trichogramma pretiosum]|uniref:hypothetical protein n=1 Tax=Wolbachia endosymbiont of Trichogramma pretiosum TaxID=125593 RepID=UPI00083929CF|nr:hypothetical protein [Wolbachia endosymbiont of Trichogramma pretiosum]OCA05883.1 hypothetical protein wTpre_201 [Wolbachia endosymbiont of Trichogramma pretiosum]
MAAVLSVTEGKNKVIVSGLVGVLSTLVFLTVIHIAAKIAIIVTATAVAYALLSLLNKLGPKSVKTDDMSEDEGYSSVDEGEEKDTIKELKITETELEGGLKNKRAEEEMKNGLPKRMDFAGNSLSKSADTKDSHFVSSATNIVIEPLSKHIDVFGNPLPEQPPSNLTNIGLGSSESTRKLYAAEWLLQHGNINNDVRKVLGLTIISKDFNGLGFNR